MNAIRVQIKRITAVFGLVVVLVVLLASSVSVTASQAEQVNPTPTPPVFPTPPPPGPLSQVIKVSVSITDGFVHATCDRWSNPGAGVEWWAHVEGGSFGWFETGPRGCSGGVGQWTDLNLPIHIKWWGWVTRPTSGTLERYEFTGRYDFDSYLPFVAFADLEGWKLSSNRSYSQAVTWKQWWLANPPTTTVTLPAYGIVTGTWQVAPTWRESQIGFWLGDEEYPSFVASCVPGSHCDYIDGQRFLINNVGDTRLYGEWWEYYPHTQHFGYDVMSKAWKEIGRWVNPNVDTAVCIDVTSDDVQPYHCEAYPLQQQVHLPLVTK